MVSSAGIVKGDFAIRSSRKFGHPRAVHILIVPQPGQRKEGSFLIKKFQHGIPLPGGELLADGLYIFRPEHTDGDIVPVGAEKMKMRLPNGIMDFNEKVSAILEGPGPGPVPHAFLSVYFAVVTLA